MTDQETTKIGDFCWVELCTPNIENAKNFYQTILNWQYDNMPMPQGGDYTMIMNGGNPIAGAYQITPELESEGAKPFWGSYVLVDDLNKTTEKAKKLGATVYKEPFGVSDMGRMSVLADPTGAVFYLWDPTQGPGPAHPKHENGNVGWNELATTDMQKAEKFYTKLFGWDAETQEVAPGKNYTTFMNAGRPVAGMLKIMEDWKDVPPRWGVYFSVTNIDEAIKKAKELSGRLVYEPIDHPEVGRFTMIQDPEGVHFSLIQFKTA